MKIKNIFSFARESISRNLKQFLLLNLLSLLGFVILGVIMLLVMLLNQGEIEVNRVLQDQLDRAGSVVMTDSTWQNLQGNSEFYEKLRKLEGMEQLFWYSESDYFDGSQVEVFQNVEVPTNQSDSEKDFLSGISENIGGTLTTMLPCENTTLSGVKAMGISLKNGSTEEIEKQRQEGEEVVLLGANYDASLIGKRFSFYGKNYYIAGQLENGARILSTRLDVATDSTTKYTQVLDNYLLMCFDEKETPQTGNYTFIWKSGMDYGTIRNEIQAAAKQCNVVVGTTKMKSVIQENNQVFKTMKDSFVLLFIVLSISTFFIFCSNQFINIMNRKSEYGIMYASGCTTKDLTKIQMMEVVFINAIAYCLAMAGMVIGIRLIMSYNRYFMIQSIYFIKHDIWWMVLIFAVFFTVISAMLPIRYIKRMKPVYLIGGNET